MFDFTVKRGTPPSRHLPRPGRERQPESLGLDSMSLMELVVAAEEYGIDFPDNALDLRLSSPLG
ncbi:acyl carrier protein [Streptomyces huasconensis]|uniref:acyl carrier protein n=1 Tax=Streptomyces huasconensis TaxID=1854574 RepID=UPI00340D69C5